MKKQFVVEMENMFGDLVAVKTTAYNKVQAVKQAVRACTSPIISIVDVYPADVLKKLGRYLVDDLKAVRDAEEGKVVLLGYDAEYALEDEEEVEEWMIEHYEWDEGEPTKEQLEQAKRELDENPELKKELEEIAKMLGL